MSASKPTLRDLFSHVKSQHPVMGYGVLAVGVKENTFTVKLSGGTPDSGFDALKSDICRVYSLEKIAFEFVPVASKSQVIREELSKRYPSLSFGEDMVSIDVADDAVNIDIFSSALFVRFNDMKNEIMRCVHECLGNTYRVFVNCKADTESENEQKKKRDEQYSALLKELA